MLDAELLAGISRTVDEAAGAKPFPVSAPLEEGIESLLDKIVEVLSIEQQEEREEAEAERSWSPL
jgi:GTP-binding protein